MMKDLWQFHTFIESVVTIGETGLNYDDEAPTHAIVKAEDVNAAATLVRRYGKDGFLKMMNEGIA